MGPSGRPCDQKVQQEAVFVTRVGLLGSLGRLLGTFFVILVFSYFNAPLQPFAWLGGLGVPSWSKVGPKGASWGPF